MGKFDVDYGINFRVNKTELESLKRDLLALNKLQATDLMALNPKLDLKQAQQQLKQIQTYSAQVQQTLNKAFNTDLGTMNVAKLSIELRKLPINDIYNSFRKAGAAGATAFNTISSAVLKGNLQLKESHSLLDKIGTTFANTVRFGLASSVFNRMTDSLQRSWDFTKQLDTSLNDIRIVTGKSADEMERYAKVANKAARNLGATTNDYVKSSLIYYQQGLNDEETQARSDVTVKTANVTGQQASQVSEQLTAIWNGYKVQASEAELYIDKVAKVAATTAADLEEMATGMSKVASAANSAGVDIDQLNAMLATVISVTREAPETIGTSFRTIFARLGDLKMGGKDEDGLGLGQISQKVADFGINILDTKGDLREMGDIITDIAAKWDDLSRGERQALAIAAAGKQQYSRFIALFDNWDMYTKALEDSKTASGELQKQQDIYMESTEAHLNKLTAAQERVGDAFVDNGAMNDLLDVVTALTNGFGNFVEALGGGGKFLLNLGSIATRVFSKQIAAGINSVINNMGIAKQNARALQQQLDDLKWMQNKLANDSKGPKHDAGLDTKVKYREQMQQFAPNMSQEDIQNTNDLIDKLGEAVSKREQYNQQYERTLQLVNTMNQVIADENGEAADPVKELYNKDAQSGENIDVDSEIYQRLQQDIQPQIEATMASFKELRQVEQDYIKDTDDIDEATKNYNKLADNLENITEQAEKLKDQGFTAGMDPEDIQKLEDALQGLTNTYMDEVQAAAGEGPFDELLGSDRAWTAEFNERIKLVEEFIQTVQQRVREGLSTIETEQATEGEERNHQDDNVNFNQQNVDDAFNEQKRQQLIQGIVEITGAVGGLSAGIQAFIGIGDIWQNQDLSTGEKVFQIITALTMGIGQLVTSSIILKTQTIAVTGALAGETAALKIKRLEQMRGVKLNALEVISINLKTIAQKIHNGELMKEIVLQAIKHKWLLLIAIAIAAVTTVVWLAVKAYNADAEAAKKAAEEAKQATEAYNNMKSAYESLMQAIADYKEGRKALEEMTAGTDEWNDKVKELNQSVLDLIGAYPELAKFVKNIDGQLVIEDEDLDQFAKVQEKALANANMVKISATQTARDAQVKSDTTDLKREINNDGFWGATAKTLIPVIGPFVSAAEHMTNELSDWQMDALVQAMEESNYSILDNKLELAKLGIIDNRLIETLQENRGSLIELTETIKANEIAEKVENQQQIDQYLKANSTAYNGLGQEQQQRISEMMANTDFKESALYKDTRNQYNDKEAAEEYKKLLKLNTTSKPEIKDGNITYKVKDADGNENDMTVAVDTAKDFIALQTAIKNTGGQINSYISTMQKMDNAYQGASKTVKEFIKTIGDGKIDNLDSLTREEVQDFSKNTNLAGMTNIDAQRMGYDNINDLREKIQQAEKDFETSWNNVTNSLSETPKTFMQQIDGNLDVSKMTLKTRKVMVESLQSLYNAFGQEGMSSYEKVLKASGNKQQEFIEKLGDIDWSAMSAKEDFINIANELQMSLPQDVVDDFVHKMKSVHDAFNNLDGVDLSNFNAAVEKLAAGKNVTDEQFEAIEKVLGSDINKYITTMADGTHQLIISAERLKEIVLNLSLERLSDNKKGLIEQYNTRKNAAAAGKQLMAEANDKNSEKNKQIQQKTNERTEKIRQDRNSGAVGYSIGATGEVFKESGLKFWEYKDKAEAKGTAYRQETEAQMQLSNDTGYMERYIGVVEAMSGAIDVSSDKIKEWKDAINNNSVTTDMVTEFTSKVADCNNILNEQGEAWNKLQEDIKAAELSVAMMIDDVSQLQDLYKQNQDDPMKGIGKEAFDARYLQLSMAKETEGLDSSEVSEYAKGLREAAKEGKGLSKELTDNADSAEELSKQVIRMNRGVDTLADNWEDWSSILKKSSHTSQEYIEAMNDTKDALYDITGVEAEYISNDYVTKHMDDIAKAAKGDEEAIDSLRSNLTDEIVAKIILDHDNFDDAKITTEQFKQDWEALKNMAGDFEVGKPILNTDEFTQKAQELIENSGMTAQEINNLFRSIKMEPNIQMVGKMIKHQVPTQIETWIPMDDGPSITVKDPDGNDQQIKGFSRRKVVTQGEPVTAEEYMEIPSLTTDGSTPNVRTSFTKLGGGSMNNYSSSNSGGKGPGKSSKSGGGSKSKPKKEKHNKDEFDRYHKVDTQLSKISNHLDKIQSQEKKLTGAKLIANLNGQLSKLDNRLANLREKMKIAEGEQKELQNKLSPEGVQFNPDGTISNYIEILRAKENAYNALVDQYNSLSKEQQEKWDENETLSKAKEKYEQFKKDLDRYDELISDFIPGLENEIQDAIDEEIEINIKKFNLEFEVKLDIADAQKDWNEFKRKILDDIDDDDILGNARARATDDLGVYLSGTDGKDGLLGAGVKQTQSILKELKDMDEKGWSNVYGDDRVSALEDLQEAYQNVEQSLMEIKEIQEDVAQAVLDQMDAVVDAMDKVADLMDTVDSQIEHDIKVIEMVYGETDYDAKGKYMEQRQKNNLDTLGTAKENRDYWEQQMNLIDDKTSEAYQKAQENFFKYNDAVNDAIEKSIEDAQEKAENAIDGIFKKYNDEITNGKGLDYTEQQWELVNDVADQYLDTVNAAFGIRQLEGKWKDAIDQTDNIGAQKKLNTLMEEQLKKLREKDKLTEYDIERAEKEYEIALKKLALEEAQQTKSTMRLRRDSQGNYRYEYVADENQIAKLQDELDALENSLYNFDKERWLEKQNEIIDATLDMENAIKEIMLDASLSFEEKEARKAEIYKLYTEKCQNITDQAMTAQTNLYDSGANEIAKIWDEQGEDFQSLSDEEKRILVEEMLPQFETGVNDMIEKFSGPDGFEKQTTDSMNAISDVTKEYEEDLDDIEEKAGIAFDEIREGQDDVLDKMPDMINDAEDYVEVMQDELSELQDINEELKKKLDYYKQIQIDAKKAAEEAWNYWLTEKKIAQERYEQENAKKNNNAGGNNGNTGNNNGGNTSSTPSANGPGKGGGNYTVKSGDTLWDLAKEFGGSSSRWGEIYSRNKDIIDSTARKRGMAANGHWIFPGTQLYIPFDTGGYTGDWSDSYGRLALLHKKELVFNADDTENMLDMLSITRDVVAAAGPRGLGSRLMIPQGEASALEQNVHIEATFPGVEDAAEIKQALNDLVNMAAQRANRNTRG